MTGSRRMTGPRGRATLAMMWRGWAVYGAIYGALDRAGGLTGRWTRDVMLAHRWVWQARASHEAVSLGVRRGWQRWTRVSALGRPEPTPRERGQGDALAMVAEAERTIAALPGRARVRAAARLGCGGLDGAETSTLLAYYEGFFPDVEAGVAWTLHARLGARGHDCLRWLDVRALTQDLVAAADLWTLREAGDGRWPAGVHLFAARALGAGVRRPGARRGRGPIISHVLPR